MVNRMLDAYLKRISDTLNSQTLVIETFEKTAYFLELNKESDHIEKEEIVNFIGFLDKYKLRTEPKLSLGIIERGVESPLVFYRNEGLIDYTSKFYKNARLAVQLSVIMARADMNVDANEIDGIKKIIWMQEGIPERERIFLYAKARYLLLIDRAYDERYRDYVKIALSKEKTIDKILDLSESSRASLIKVAMDIAISDGHLDSKELSFIKELYRASGLSVRSAKADVERYAREQYVNISTEKDNVIDMFTEDSFIEIEDVLGELLLDFDDF